MKSITIADITLRECEQETASKLSFKEKQEIAKLLEKINVDIIETGYVKKMPTDAVFIRMLAGAMEQSILSIPVKPDKASISETWDALSKAKKPRLNLIVPTSAIGMEYAQKVKPDELLSLIGEMIGYAKTLCGDVEFTADDAIRSERDFLAKAISAAVTAGASTVTLCDSAGDMLPDEFGEFIASVRAGVPELKGVTLGFQIKDKLAMASAATLKGIAAGADLIKVSGGSESETQSLAAFLDILSVRGDTLGISCNLNTTSYKRICAGLKTMTGGSAAGAGSAAVGAMSADADSAARKNGEDSMPPENADINALRNYIQSIGYDISDEDIERIFVQYQDIARSKSVVADDIEALIAETAGQAAPTYKLKNYVINSGNAIAATAYLEFEKDGKACIALSAGDGPIDAAFKAAENIFGTSYELEDFRIHAVTSGREATGDALVKLRCGGKLYSGRGVSTDIVAASIRAYLSAVNKIISDT